MEEKLVCRVEGEPFLRWLCLQPDDGFRFGKTVFRAVPTANPLFCLATFSCPGMQKEFKVE